LKDKSQLKKINLTPSHYTLENLAKTFETTTHNVKLKAATNTSSAAMVIYNYENKGIGLNASFASFLGIEDIKFISFVNTLNLIRLLPSSFIAIL